MSQEIHPFLKRQLKRYFNKEVLTDDEQAFINAVDASYKHFSRERELMEIASHKMMEEMKRKNESLKRLISSLDEFNYHVSHDLKSGAINNLTLSRMLNKYLNSGKDELVLEITKKLEDNAERNLGTIKQFLKIAKLDINLSKARDVEELNFKEVLKDVCLEFDSKDFTIDITISENETVNYSLIQLKSILHNLISNSIRYKKPGTIAKISVSFQCDGQLATIYYEDDGIGIDLQKRKHKIFKPFEADRRHSDSSGVGLYLTKKIIESNGGTIYLESEPDEGVQFKINLLGC